MNEKSPGLRKDKNYADEKSLIDHYISREEIWACTTCNACAQECPVNIDHPSLILELRRYLFMEESAAPAPLNAMSTNIENNGAPWQYPPTDRLKWADNLYINE
jgi:Fe-S oxidoreductase